MSKWIKLKIALLTSTTVLSALQLGGCLGGDLWERVLPYVVIGNLFD